MAIQTSYTQPTPLGIASFKKPGYNGMTRKPTSVSDNVHAQVERSSLHLARNNSASSQPANPGTSMVTLTITDGVSRFRPRASGKLSQLLLVPRFRSQQLQCPSSTPHSVSLHSLHSTSFTCQLTRVQGLGYAASAHATHITTYLVHSIRTGSLRSIPLIPSSFNR